MSVKQYLYILLFLLPVTIACNKTESVVSKSSNATITSMVFYKNDTTTQLDDASFVIKEASDTGLIYNVDSLPVGTPLDSVRTVFSFQSTPSSAYVFYENGTSVALTGVDTLDFSNTVRLRVISSDETTTRWYKINVRVHKIDPDLYVWKKLCDAVYTGGSEDQWVTQKDGNLLLYVGDGVSLHLYSSADGTMWEEQTTNLPQGCNVRNILDNGEKMFYPDGESLWISEDGISWIGNDLKDSVFTLENSLLKIPVKINDVGIIRVSALLFLAKNKSKGTYHLAVSFDDCNTIICDSDALSNDFPISDYARVSFLSTTCRPRALIMGGFAANGACVNGRWSVEYANEKFTWSNFSNDDPSFSPIHGASIVYYDSKLYMFGGADDKNEICPYPIIVSENEGMTWSQVDTAKNCISNDFLPRKNMAVTISEDGTAIYLVGGRTRTQSFSDVYCGKLNSIDW